MTKLNHLRLNTSTILANKSSNNASLEQNSETKSLEPVLAPLTDAELMRYSRQILLDKWDITAQERLKSSLVIVVGAGGLGCPATETLARAGVGNIFIVDDDVIESSNLQRQTLFTDQDIGHHKATTAKSALQQINPNIRVECATQRIDNENASFVLNQALTIYPNDTPLTSILILDCTDNFAIRELLNKISVVNKLPLLSASAIAMTGQLALYEPYKDLGCYHCVFGSTLASGSNKAVSQNQQNCSTSGVLASTTTVMGNLQANLALQYLGLAHNPLQGKLMVWNGRTMTQNLMRYRQDTACPICANTESA